jgi:DMSO/TMAO reductase YedYZ molybdopterin-dependent catalytic subunit
MLSRQDLLDMDQATERLPIACVEGWSTTQTWTGVRLADLLALVGTPTEAGVLVTSLQRSGPFREARLARNQVLDQRSLLALEVNGADLSLDHGFPARVIVPAAPGVHCTKWVRGLQLLDEQA